MSKTFKIGDVVFLNSNQELLLTVDFVLDDKPTSLFEVDLSQQMRSLGFKDGDVSCTWFDGTVLKDSLFKAETLTQK